MTRSSSSQDRPKSDLYADVTNKIVAAIEAGAATYTLPWQRIAGLPKNVASHRSYRGINTLLLWLIGNQKGYTTPYWATFKQWIELGHPVRKGETSATVVFWKLLDQAGGDSAEPSDGGEAADNRRPILARAYHVFNASQVEGYAVPELTVLSEVERDAKAEAFFSRLPISVHHEGGQAFYRPSTDSVHLPEFGLFKDANSYYAVRGHESVHATGAKHRLDRDLSGRFGSESYAVEELVAELGAAFLCADLGLSPEPRLDHAGYIESWLKVLKGDSRAIFTAAGKAQAAVDWLHGQQEGGT
jgi:antirestriction protein ArdC